MSTANALVDMCEERFRDSTNLIYSAAYWLNRINDAYMEVINASPFWPFLQTSPTNLSYSAQAANVALPADTLRVDAVFNATDNYPLTVLDGDAEAWATFPSLTTDFGMPLFYRVYAGAIELYPRPSATTSLRLMTALAPVELTGAAEPIFPESWHRLLVLGALAKGYEDDDNPGPASNYRAQFDRGIEQMKDALLVPQAETYAPLIDRWD